MVNMITLFGFFLTPHAAAVTPPPTPTPAVVAPAPAAVQQAVPAPVLRVVLPAPATTTPVTSPAAPTTPAEPVQPPAADVSTLSAGQCAIAFNANQQNPETGQWIVATQTYYGDCGEAQALAAQYPGSIVVQAPATSTAPSTSPSMGAEPTPGSMTNPAGTSTGPGRAVS